MTHIGGEAGKKAGHIKPFESLDTKGLQKGIKATGWEIVCSESKAPPVKTKVPTKKDLRKTIKTNLKGVQRVPSLLLTYPEEPLEDINLKNYQILDCEPLHDLKGHLSILLEELPHILQQPLRGEIEAIIDCNLYSRETKRGGDYRLTVIHILALLRKRKTPQKALQFLETTVDISNIMYTGENKRSPRLLLKFYNTTWIHFELCKELFHSPKSVSHRKMFGIILYLHSISIHVAGQLKIINLKATNTEHEE